MATYRIMLKNQSDVAKVSIIVSSSEESAMRKAEWLYPGFSAQFAVKLFNGSPAD